METLVKGFVFYITKPHFLKLGQGEDKHIHHHQAAVGTCLLVSDVCRPSTPLPPLTRLIIRTTQPPIQWVLGGGSFPTDQPGYKTAQSPPATSF